MNTESLPQFLNDSQVSQSELQQFLCKNIPKYDSLEIFIDFLEDLILKRDGREKKNHGTYYTPKSIVDLILDEMDFPPAISTRTLRLLDLSCGTGRFLGEGLRRILKHTLLQGKTQNQSVCIAADSIGGVEIDPVARNITRIYLVGIFLDLLKDHLTSTSTLPEIPIHQQDCLVEELDNLSQTPGSWDFIVLNPPYVTQKGEKSAPKISLQYAQMLKKRYKSLNPRVYKDQWGINVPGHLKVNLLVPFIEKAVNLLAPHGRLGFIVHKNLLDVGSYWPLRHLILNTCQIRKIIDLSTEAFPEITGETTILILEKKSPNSIMEGEVEIVPRLNRTTLHTPETGKSRFKVSQQRYRESFQESFLIYPREEHYAVRNKIWQSERVVKLGSIATLSSFGINVPKSHESTQIKHPDWVPAIRGRDIRRFCLLRQTRVVDFDPSALTRSGHVGLFATPVKIVMQRVGPRLQACIDFEQRVCFNSTNIIVPLSPEVNFAKYLLAVLNSSLIDTYYKLFLSNQNVLTVNVTQAKLAELPVILPSASEFKKVVDLVENLLYTGNCREDSKKTEVIDQQIAKIYLLSPEDVAILRNSH